MRGEDIKDEGFSNHEDHKRMLPNVETLDLSPYLVGVLRQLRGQRDAVGSLRQFRRQSLSSGAPTARELSPRLSEASQITPSRSISGSAASSSTRKEGVVHTEDSALSDLESDDDPDKEHRAKRHKASATEMGPPLADALTEGEPSTSAVPEHTVSEGKEPTISRQPPATRKSKRKTLSHDSAAYKPSEDDVRDEEVEEETQTRRNSTRKATKRSRTMEGTPANAPRPKKTRLSRGVSLAGASTVDS
ncbi:hypothetical protein BJV78DRAFT_1213031 [Lactifluus subvellereus]|nr:hypothetical protein BJV78DRAFT_1213031 [Lactifluus subvellereus]